MRSPIMWRHLHAWLHGAGGWGVRGLVEGAHVPLLTGSQGQIYYRSIDWESINTAATQHGLEVLWRLNFINE